MKKVQVQQAHPKPGAHKKALAKSPHAQVIHADGSKQSSPNQHKPTDGGLKGGLKNL
jgi:hypothetical protein